MFENTRLIVVWENYIIVRFRSSLLLIYCSDFYMFLRKFESLGYYTFKVDLSFHMFTRKRLSLMHCVYWTEKSLEKDYWVRIVFLNLIFKFSLKYLLEMFFMNYQINLGLKFSHWSILIWWVPTLCWLSLLFPGKYSSFLQRLV